MKSSEQFFIYTKELNNVFKSLKDKEKRKKQIPNLLTLSSLFFFYFMLVYLVL